MSTASNVVTTNSNAIPNFPGSEYVWAGDFNGVSTITVPITEVPYTAGNILISEGNVTLFPLGPALAPLPIPETTDWIGIFQAAGKEKKKRRPRTKKAAPILFTKRRIRLE